EVNKGGNYPKAYTINFEGRGGKLYYKDISVEDWDRQKSIKYLYREKASQGAHYTPTARITGTDKKDVEKTFENRIEQWFSRLEREHSNWLRKSDFFRNLYEAFISEKDKIKDDFVKLRTQYKDGGFVTLVFYLDGSKKYLGDIEEFVEYLLEFSKENYEEVSNEGVCCLCKKKDKVFGNASPITFYTLDKPGFIAGGMRREGGYKNFPLCFECLLQLNEGAAYMRAQMEFKFAGLRYYLIPQVIYNSNQVLGEVMNIYDNFKQEADGKVSLSNAERIASDEEDILGLLKDVEDTVSLKFLFFQEQKKKFIILMLMEDILPSRIRTLFNAKQKAENHFIFKDHKFSANLIQDVKFNYGILRRISPSIKSFLEIVNKSFKNQKIEKQYILKLIMERVRNLFNENNSIKLEVLQAFLCLLYLDELGVLKSSGGDLGNMTDNNSILATSELSVRINQFFEEFKPTFDTSAKKAVFLTGVLAQHLLSIQKNDKGGSTPFRSQLKGLKMNEKDIKALLPKIQQKLEEYKKNYYVQLEKIASIYFLEAGEDWGMSIDEINFYFVLGMNLNDAVNKEGIPYFKVKGDELNE
ncbi:MAG: TIGR02556 family CRISPR-associated protein, partial [Clostridia bacterium]|nr:TIGR02556 family CRISPR-associated protein [Clostridia bacterium]